MSETILLINKHVENVLEDRPSRDEVLSILDNIKSLERIKSTISFYITSKDEFDAWRSLWRFIHLSELEVGCKRVFYYELSAKLYNWLANHSFSEIIGQIAYYLVYKDTVSKNSKDNALKKEIYPAVYEIIKQKQKLISELKLNESDITEHKKLLIEHDINPSFFKDYEMYLKYNLAHFKEYGAYPISPFRVPIHYDVLDKNWKKIIEKWNFNFTTYESNKGYYNINRNRLSFEPDEIGYSADYLKVWKYFYKNDFDINDSIYENVKVVSKKASKKEFFLLCDYCNLPLDFENSNPDFVPPEDHEYSCNKCFYEEYFEN